MEVKSKGEYLGTKWEEVWLMKNYGSFCTQGELPGGNECFSPVRMWRKIWNRMSVFLLKKFLSDKKSEQNSSVAGEHPELVFIFSVLGPLLPLALCSENCT